MDGNIIRIENVSKTYLVGDSKVEALKSVSYFIKAGDFVAIMGPSGSGKSTLMNIIGCLDRPTEGKYFLEDEEVSQLDKNKLARIRNGKLGFVFQTFNLLARTTALENTELPLLYSNVSKKHTAQMAFKALASVGLGGREYHKTNQLSGGEMQRVAIARALVNNPSVLLADEPTGNLDSKTGEEILQVFKKLNEEKGITLIVVTHDPDVASLSKRRIFLRDGRIIREEVN